MRVLITGATGFFGSQMARVLVREGCETYALMRPTSNPWRIREVLPSLHVVYGDMLHGEKAITDVVDRVRPDLCLHFAWYAEPGVYLTSEINLQHLAASVMLAAALAKRGCRRLAAVGSISEYDLDLGYLSEASATRPNTLYAASKLALQTALAQFSVTSGMEVVWPRVSFLYGPREDEQRLVPAILCALLRGQPTRLTPGEQVRDYLHTADAAEGLWAVANSGLCGPVNIGSGIPVTVREMALRAGAIVGRPELVELGALPYRPNDAMFACMNTSLVRDDRMDAKPRPGRGPNADYRMVADETARGLARALSCVHHAAFSSTVPLPSALGTTFLRMLRHATPQSFSKVRHELT